MSTQNEQQHEAKLVKNFNSVKWIKNPNGGNDLREPIAGFVDLTFEIAYLGESTFRVDEAYAKQFERNQFYVIKFNLNGSKTKSGKACFYPSQLLECVPKK